METDSNTNFETAEGAKTLWERFARLVLRFELFLYSGTRRKLEQKRRKQLKKLREIESDLNAFRIVEHEIREELSPIKMEKEEEENV